VSYLPIVVNKIVSVVEILKVIIKC